MTKETYLRPRKRRKAVIILGCTSSSIAAEAIANNLDLLTQILLRLPVKSLLRFKCVSKHWLSLISDSRFGSNHSLQGLNPRSVSGLYFYPLNFKEEISFICLTNSSQTLPTLVGAIASFKKTSNSNIIIRYSSNGLMLLSQTYLNSNSRYVRRYMVANLTIQKYTLLPQPLVRASIVFGAYLILDIFTKLPHYKVVLVGCHVDHPRPSRDIYIYSTESGSWRRISVATTRRRIGHGVVWKGGIHWLSYHNFHVRFEVDGEKLIELPNLPPSLTQDKIRYFGECDDKLLIVYNWYMEFRILEMEEEDKDYGSWIYKFRVNLRHLVIVFPETERRTPRGCKCHVLFVVKGANENDLVLVLAIPGNVISYNVKGRTIKMLGDYPLGDFVESSTSYLYWYSYQYIESLFPV